ncbi:MAG: DegV family protein [Actinomycetota bacterium]|nr:DegV family protein [Actinomycetota bacterium]
MSVKVVVDSGADIPSELVTKHGIEIVPLKIRFGDREYVDTKDLTTDQFWELCETSKEFPQTAAPSSGDFETAFLKAKADGFDEVVCITLSSDLSATFQAATLAANNLQNEIKIELIDSRLATFAIGNLAIASSIEAVKGTNAEQISALVRSRIPFVHAFGALDTLENLRKGGRIGKATALFGSLLSFKPIIDVRNGIIEGESKQRTRGKALNYLIEKTVSYGAITDLAIIHANAPDVESFAEQLKTATKIQDLIVAKIGPVIGTHAGPRTMGVTFRTLE